MSVAHRGLVVQSSTGFEVTIQEKSFRETNSLDRDLSSG